MRHDIAGRWQLEILNSDPITESNQFLLSDGLLLSLDADTADGIYEVLEGALVLNIAMPAALHEGAWSLRICFPLNGALAGEIMLGHAEAVFAHGEPISVAECSFHRLREPS